RGCDARALRLDEARMTAPTALAFFWLVVGLILGAASASAFWWLWAFRAMHPHDAPEQPTSADRGSGKGQVPTGAENAPETAEMLAELERYLSFDPNKYDRYTIRPVVMPDGRSALEHLA